MAAHMTSAVFNDDARRSAVQRHPTLNGIDYLEVVTTPQSSNQRVLRVFFLPPDPADDPLLKAKVKALIVALAAEANRVNIDISGGVRRTNNKITVIEVTAVTDRSTVADHLLLRVDQPGDFSDYVLMLPDLPTLDPFFQSITFNFKAGCPSRFDCKPRSDCPPEALAAPAIDYMAKDYDSFRQALIDFLPTILPGWTERREADLGMSLLELFAYMGDQLSYFQDAVANEAYLETARQRISVRRHARLIDYAMHDGQSAMTFLHVEVSDDTTISGDQVKALQVMTQPRALPNAPRILSRSDPLTPVALGSADAVFEVLLRDANDTHLRERYDTLTFFKLLNTIEIYAWENDEMFLPRGATSADLASRGANVELPLRPGDYLLFEELVDPGTGLAVDRDPTHRQVVRLTRIDHQTDPLTGRRYARIVWSSDDALTFPVCVATKDEEGKQLRNVSVARGNLVLAYHGVTVNEQHRVPDPEKLAASGLLEAPPSLSKYRFALQASPLGFLPAADVRVDSVVELRALTPRRARPAVIRLTEAVKGGGQTFEWEAVTPDLLASSRFAQEFMVETDNDNRAVLRFGDNQFGMTISAAADLNIAYRVGVGRVGNVGADTLRCFIFDSAAPEAANIVSVRNPVPAWGGADPESTEAVKQLAPAAFHAESYRAVTEEDYARAARLHPEVRNAVARFRWTGSWHTVFLFIDPQNATDISPDLEADVRAWVERVTLAGYDLEINGPTFVPLMIDLDVCASAGYFPSDVETALHDALSNRRFADGRLAFFHPDNFTFDQPIYLSRLFAAIEQVAGVESVTVTRFARRYEPDPEPSRPATRINRDRGYIDAGPLEIIRLDNDPSLPENGILNITVRGGQ